MGALAGLATLGRGVDRWVTRITLACAWFNLLCLIAVTATDVTILLPICAILIYHGADSALTAFLGGETPEAFSGLPIQWVVKSTVPIGYLLLFLSGTCVMTRNFLFLIGKEPAPAPQGELFAQHIHKGASDS
jgi:hypothetical protein